MSSKLLAGLGLCAAVLAASCATQTQPKSQAAAPAAPPRLAAQAMAFESFMRSGRTIDPRFSDAGEVRDALKTGAAHDPRQLEAGMIAYAALAALQEPGFVQGVRREGGHDLARKLNADPSLALRLPGGKAAASRAGAALARQGDALAGAGERVKRAAYTVQHQSWSKRRVADPAARLALVKRISTTGYRPQAGDQAQLRTALASAGRRSTRSPVVARGVALAALTVLGQEGRGRALLRDPVSGSCLRIAKLNLYQCLASSGPQYEDIYCLGQHALIEPGQCVSDAVVEAPRMSPVSYRR